MYDEVDQHRHVDSMTPGVEIIYFDVSLHNADSNNILSWLSNDERDRANQFACPITRRQYIICRAYLRAHLTAKLNCHPIDVTLKVTPYGKPYALTYGSLAPLAFNLSHSGNHGVIAFSSIGDIGVDIERYRREIDLMQIAKSFFHDVELKYLRNCDNKKSINLFYRVWTLKEAATKAVGRGLYIDPKSFSLPDKILNTNDQASLNLIGAQRLDEPSFLKLRTLSFSENTALAFAIKP